MDGWMECAYIEYRLKRSQGVRHGGSDREREWDEGDEGDEGGMRDTEPLYKARSGGAIRRFIGTNCTT